MGAPCEAFLCPFIFLHSVIDDDDDSLDLVSGYVGK